MHPQGGLPVAMEFFGRGVRLNCVGFVFVSQQPFCLVTQRGGALRDETKTKFSTKESGMFHPPKREYFEEQI